MKVVADGSPDLLKVGEVADLLRTDPRTVGRHADAGRFGDVIRTPGGHRRIRTAAVVAQLNDPEWQRAEDEATAHLAAARTDLDTIAAGLLPAAAPTTEGEQ